MASTPPATSYQALCQDPDKNPLGKDDRLRTQLAAIYSSFKTTGTNPMTPDDLLESVLLDMDRGMIGGLLMFRETDNTAFPRDTTNLRFEIFPNTNLVLPPSPMPLI